MNPRRLQLHHTRFRSVQLQHHHLFVLNNAPTLIMYLSDNVSFLYLLSIRTLLLHTHAWEVGDYQRRPRPSTFLCLSALIPSTINAQARLACCISCSYHSTPRAVPRAQLIRFDALHRPEAGASIFLLNGQLSLMLLHLHPSKVSQHCLD